MDTAAAVHRHPAAARFGCRAAGCALCAPATAARRPRRQVPPPRAPFRHCNRRRLCRSKPPKTVTAAAAKAAGDPGTGRRHSTDEICPKYYGSGRTAPPAVLQSGRQPVSPSVRQSARPPRAGQRERPPRCCRWAGRPGHCPQQRWRPRASWERRHAAAEAASARQRPSHDR